MTPSREFWTRASTPLWVGLMCAALAAACGQAPEAPPDDPGSADKGTGFGKAKRALEHCDGDDVCAEGLACVCNVCTTTCVDDGACWLPGVDVPLTCVGADRAAPFEAQCAAYAAQTPPPEGLGVCLARCGADQGGVCPALPADADPDATTPDQCVEGACTGVPESLASSVRPSPLLNGCSDDGDCGDAQACVCSVCTATCGADGDCAGASAQLGAPLVCVSDDAVGAEAFASQCTQRASEVVPDVSAGLCLAACRADLTCQNTRVGEGSDRPDVCQGGVCVDPCEDDLGWAPSNYDAVLDPQWQGEPEAAYRLDVTLSNRGQTEDLYLRLCHHDRLPLDGDHGVRYRGQSARHGVFEYTSGIALEVGGLCSIWVLWFDVPTFVQGDTLDVSASVVYPQSCLGDWNVDCTAAVDAPCGTCWGGDVPTMTRTCAPGPPP